MLGGQRVKFLALGDVLAGINIEDGDVTQQGFLGSVDGFHEVGCGGLFIHHKGEIARDGLEI